MIISRRVLAYFSQTLLLVLFVLGISYANDNDFDDFGDLDLEALLDATVESASGKIQSISDAPAIIEVITAEQIHIWGASNLYEVLHHIVGVEVIENHWGRTTVNFRGISTNLFNSKVLFLFDGHPVLETGNQAFFLEQIPMNAIDRVEIIRGPGGVIFGTNAYGGVIHAFSKKSGEHHAEISALGGAALTKDKFVTDRLNTEGRASGMLDWESGFLRLDSQIVRTPQWIATVDDAASSTFNRTVRSSTTFPRGETTTTFNGKLGQNVGGGQLSLLGNFFYQEKQKWGLFPTANDTDSLTNKTKSQLIGLSWERQFDKIRFAVRGSYGRNTQINKAGMLTGPLLPPARQTDLIVLDVNTYRMTLGSNLNAILLDGKIGLESGLDLAILRTTGYALVFKSDGAYLPGVPELDDSQSVLDLGLFTQLSYYPVEPLAIVAGFRLSVFNPGQFRPDLPNPKANITPNPRVALIYRIAEKVTSKFLYGRAFRVPSLFEKFVSATGVLEGDPTLVPEIVDTFELGFDTQLLEGWNLRLNGYVSMTDNDILLVPIPAGTEQYSNTAGRLMRGIEMTTRYIWSPWLDTQGSIGFQEGTDRSSNDYLSQIARLTANVTVSGYALDRKLRFSPNYRYIGRRADLGGTSLWNATAGYRPIDWLEIGLIARNIFDKRYADVEVVRLDTPGGIVQNQPRTLSLELTGRF